MEEVKEEQKRRSIFNDQVSVAASGRGSSLKGKPKKVEVYDSELKEWFIDCIRTVKR